MRKQPRLERQHRAHANDIILLGTNANSPWQSAYPEEIIDGRVTVAGVWETGEKKQTAGLLVAVIQVKEFKFPKGIDIPNTWPTIAAAQEFFLPYDKRKGECRTCGQFYPKHATGDGPLHVCGKGAIE